MCEMTGWELAVFMVGMAATFFILGWDAKAARDLNREAGE